MSLAKLSAAAARRVDLFYRFEHRGAFMYTCPVMLQGDTNAEPRRSRLVLLEDGIPLRRAHEQHSVISGLGRGAYSHWEWEILFSTSDNSDPNTNGRSYSYALDPSGQDVLNEDGRVVLHPPFALQQGLCWGVAVTDEGDSNLDLTVSRLQLLEDDVLLGPSRAQHADICDTGGGSYSHWSHYLYFSTSDGSDPNANGRIYSYRLVEPEDESPPFHP